MVESEAYHLPWYILQGGNKLRIEGDVVVLDARELYARHGVTDFANPVSSAIGPERWHLGIREERKPVQGALMAIVHTLFIAGVVSMMLISTKSTGGLEGRIIIFRVTLHLEG